MLQLSKSQIKVIDDYIRNKGIHYFDVRSEIVDHLASDLERMMMKQQNPNFEELQHQALSRLTEQEFKDIQREKEAYLKSYWRNTIWSHLISYFKFPRILLTISITVVIYWISISLPSLPQILILIGALFMAAQVLAFQERINWLTIKAFGDYANRIILLIQGLAYYAISFITKDYAALSDNHLLTAGFAATTTMFLITNYLVGIYLPERILADLKKEYPDTYLAT